MTPHSLAGSWNEFRQQFENCLGAAKAEKAAFPSEISHTTKEKLGDENE